MIQPQIEIIILAAIVSVACSLSGVFLVLRRMSMMSDAISHSILLGIVTAYIITNNLHSPLLIISATATGVLTVLISEILRNSKLVSEDAAIGLTFPLLFSIGVILISRFASDIHLDVDAVLLGEIAFAPFYRFSFLGVDIAPQSTVIMSIILLINLIFILLFFKELKVSSFDNSYAESIGISTGKINYALMTLVSLTAVGAFDAVGSILVIALMVVPVSISILIFHDIKLIILSSISIGILSSILGYFTANSFNVSIAGSIVTVVGGIFFVVFIFKLLYSTFNKSSNA